MNKINEGHEWTPISGGMNTIPTIQDSEGLLISPSLFLRLLEWAKEDAQGDVCLHQVFEKLLNLNNGSVIGMDMYDFLLSAVDCDDETDSSDIENTMELDFNPASQYNDTISLDVETQTSYNEEDVKLFDDEDDDGLSALNKFREKFNIVSKPEQPKATISITPEEDDAIERIIKLASFKK